MKIKFVNVNEVLCWNMLQDWNCVEDFWVLVWKHQVNKAKVFWLQFLQKPGIVLGTCCMLLPGLVDRSEFTLAAVSHMLVWKIMFWSCVACSWNRIPYSSDCSQPSECENCLMLWIKFVIVQTSHSPCAWVPFSQVHAAN